MITVVLVKHLRKRRTNSNPYKKIHGIKLKNDKLYNDYLRWCVYKGEIPMDKYDFIKEIADKEKELQRLF